MVKGAEKIYFSTPKWKKNRMQHENINFTRVIIALALLRYQTLHLQNKLFSPQLHNVLIIFKTFK